MPKLDLLTCSLFGGGLALVALGAAACAESPVRSPLQASASCNISCGGTDPNPGAPGVYLGLLDPTECAESRDTDQDGLGDICEENLAWAFAPELAYAHGDNVGREPHWVARPLPNGGARIGYLLSYYVDWGVDDPLCEQNVTPSSWCRGHAGDSEEIYLDVFYDPTTQHWVLQTAHYSAHGDYNTYSAGPNGYPDALTYPSHQGAYPRSYVSYQKHANYASDGECDAAQWGFEECVPDRFARVYAGLEVNLGTRSYPMQDCMASSNPLYSDNGVIECYWTGARFSGWQGYQPDTDPYGPKLAGFGF